MKKTEKKQTMRARRHNRIRARVSGTALKPRLSVYKSNLYIYAQLIDDESSKTLAAADSRKVKGENLTAKATVVGNTIAEAAKKGGISTVVFDRGGFKYQGAVAALADGARSGGLQF
jgi:large subunit ribosomal protein L18